jgi:hypothetical protein
MGKQPKATVNKVWKAKRKEQKQKETKKEKKKRLKQQAKAKAQCLERVSPAIRNHLRQENNRNGVVRFGSTTEQEQAEFCERNRLAVQKLCSQQAAQCQLPNQNQVENESFGGFKTAVVSLLDFLKNSDDPDKLFGDIQKSPEKQSCFTI